MKPIDKETGNALARLFKLLVFPFFTIITFAIIFLQIVAFTFYMPYVYVRYGDMARIKESKIWAFEVTDWWYEMH